MVKLTIEVGNTYEVRDPKRAAHKGRDVQVKIIAFDPSFCDPYLGDNDVFYCGDGRVYAGIDSPYDLVRKI